MAEITREYIAQKRAAYRQQIDMLNGALIALDEIERELLPLEMGELQQAIGAAEIGEPAPLANAA